MAKFHGVVGYGELVKDAPGSWSDKITEREYTGDVVRNTRQLRDGEKVNQDITVNVSISIMSDAYADEHFFAIRFVEWAGALWVVEDVDVQSPRLILRLGGVYNGRRADPVPDEEDSPPESP